MSATTSPIGPRRSRLVARRRRSRARRAWVAIAVAVLAVSTLIVVLTGMRPDYDGFGWLVWGKQLLHWNLNTDGAPSWKPLSFIFTLPYALVGHAQVSLWMVTAVAGAVGGCVFAARIAFKLTGPAPSRPWAPYVAGAFASASLLGMATYSHLVLIANSDPLIVSLCLAAIDSHLSRRPRLAFALLVGASLGRPEVWAFAILYAVWAQRAIPRSRLLTVVGLALIPAFWFLIPALTSHSWLIAGKLALHQKTVIHGSRILGVIDRFRGLTATPVALAALVGVAIAVARRDLATLALAGAVVLWLVIEVAFAYHGWSAVNRYMIEPAAVMVVIAGCGVGRLLASASGPFVARWAGTAAVAALVVALVPVARARAHQARIDYRAARLHARQVTRLEAVVARIGGPDAIKSCGQPVSLVGFQSTIAWVLDLNVGDVGYRPGRAIGQGEAIVLLKPHDLGWQVRVYNMPASRARRCARLRTDSQMG